MSLPLSIPRSAAVVLLVLAVVAVVGPAPAPADRSAPATPSAAGSAVPWRAAKEVRAAPDKATKLVGAAPAKAPLVLPAFAPIAGSLDPRIRAGYELAAWLAEERWAGCGLRWTILAGIGAVETANGAHHDGAVVVSDSGTVLPEILGPVLDGSGGHARIPDSDGGELDGDTVFDRAVGPMQFLPSTWKRHGQDANGDGVADPHSIDDAALAAASYLCRAGDLRDDATLDRALFSYNHSDAYVGAVREQIARFDIEFGMFTFAMAIPPLPEEGPPSADASPPAATTTTGPPASGPPSTTTTTVARTTTTATTTTAAPATTAAPTTVAPTTTTVAPTTTAPTTTAPSEPATTPPPESG